MLSQSSNNKGTPHFSFISKDTTLSKVLEVLESCLLRFTKECWQTMFNRDSTISYDTADETDFNTEFSHHLSLEFASVSLSGQFTVRSEYPENRPKADKISKKGLRRQVDLAVRLTNGKRILAVEGKRLYDPNDKQYVSGNTGGIARFKREKHGKELGFACIVGYVQRETFVFWHDRVNQWIESEISNKNSIIQWDKSDLLSSHLIKSDCLMAYQSVHSRMTEPPIYLNHYWVDMGINKKDPFE